MKNIRFYILLLSVAFCVIKNKTMAQTNVSGGIYSNTTWTLANSPYIVVDTIVVFPGVTLTIQPGVVVKFENDKLLEIRQAQLIAVGTVNDSITFTSNSLTPTSVSWACVSISGGTLQSDFKYCNFRYSSGGLSNSSDTLKVTNSHFLENSNGLGGFHLYVDSCKFYNNTSVALGVAYGANIRNSFFFNNNMALHGSSTGYNDFKGYTYIKNCVFNYNQIGIADFSHAIIENCNITHNQFGLMDNSYELGLTNGVSLIKNCIVDSNSVIALCLGFADSVINCQIKNNGIGVSDSIVTGFTGLNSISGNEIENNGIGIKLWGGSDIITCNKICNNTLYDLYYNTSINGLVANNYWCISDSATLATEIHDGYDDINLGLVHFMPLDTTQCYLTASIMDKAFPLIKFSIFPNPVVNELTIAFSETHTGAIKIIDLFGRVHSVIKLQNAKTIVNVANLPVGLYIIEIISPMGIAKQKFIKQ